MRFAIRRLVMKLNWNRDPTQFWSEVIAVGSSECIYHLARAGYGFQGPRQVAYGEGTEDAWEGGTTDTDIGIIYTTYRIETFYEGMAHLTYKDASMYDPSDFDPGWKARGIDWNDDSDFHRNMGYR